MHMASDNLYTIILLTIITIFILIPNGQHAVESSLFFHHSKTNHGLWANWAEAHVKTTSLIHICTIKDAGK